MLKEGYERMRYTEDKYEERFSESFLIGVIDTIIGLSAIEKFPENNKEREIYKKSVLKGLDTKKVTMIHRTLSIRSKRIIKPAVNVYNKAPEKTKMAAVCKYMVRSMDKYNCPCGRR